VVSCQHEKEIKLILPIGLSLLVALGATSCPGTGAGGGTPPPGKECNSGFNSKFECSDKFRDTFDSYPLNHRNDWRAGAVLSNSKRGGVSHGYTSQEISDHGYGHIDGALPGGGRAIRCLNTDDYEAGLNAYNESIKNCANTPCPHPEMGL